MSSKISILNLIKSIKSTEISITNIRQIVENNMSLFYCICTICINKNTLPTYNYGEYSNKSVSRMYQHLPNVYQIVVLYITTSCVDRINLL